MPPEESPEAKYDRLKRKLQDSILSQYPNPERKGCPGSPVLEGVASRFSDESVESDPNWEHITHCSECYREFLDFRRKLKSAARKRSYVRRVGLGAVVVVAVIAVLFLVSRNRGSSGLRPQNAEVAYNKITIDIPTVQRSDDGQRASSPIVFDAKPDELTVNLPVGSKAGQYELPLIKNEQPVISAHADAAITEGTTAFTVKIDLSKITPGSYSMSVRQVPWDWNYFPVVVR